MNTKLNEITEETIGVVCTRPTIKNRLVEYLDNPLRYQGAEEIEEHLLECRECREFVDDMIGMRTEARGAVRTPRAEVRVIRLAAFRKR